MVAKWIVGEDIGGNLDEDKGRYSSWPPNVKFINQKVVWSRIQNNWIMSDGYKDIIPSRTRYPGRERDYWAFNRFLIANCVETKMEYIGIDTKFNVLVDSYGF